MSGLRPTADWSPSTMMLKIEARELRWIEASSVTTGSGLASGFGTTAPWESRVTSMVVMVTSAFLPGSIVDTTLAEPVPELDRLDLGPGPVEPRLPLRVLCGG